MPTVFTPRVLKRIWSTLRWKDVFRGNSEAPTEEEFIGHLTHTDANSMFRWSDQANGLAYTYDLSINQVQVITDGLIESTNLLIGRNMIRNFTETIREAKINAQAQAKTGTKQAKKKGRNMPRSKESKVREERITMEIVVDAYNEQERAMGWYCYLDEKLQFPFTAKCINVRNISPLEEGDEKEITGMAPESECKHEMFVEMRWEKRNLAVPLSQLEVVHGDKQTKEAVGDWHYWVNRGYQF